MSRTVLLTGVTGFVGSDLVPRLLADGHDVRGFARDASKVEADIPVVEGDAETGAGLTEAMRGVDVAVYLIHSMEGGEEDFDETELETARTFVAAAREAGVRRVVFLGGLTPSGDDEDSSEHLESRNAVEQVLLEGFPEGAAFRASMVVGAGSASFDLLAALVEKLPFMALPAWRKHKSAPIDHRDVIEYLACAVSSDRVTDARSYEIGGADEVTYEELVERMAKIAGNEKPTLPLPISATPIASRIAAVVSGQDAGLVKPLMESLEYDLVPDDREARETFGVEPRSLDDALEHALKDRAEASAPA